VQKPTEFTVGAERSGAWYSRFVDEADLVDHDDKPASYVGRSEVADPELHAWLAGAAAPFPAKDTIANQADTGYKPIRHRFGLRNATRRRAEATLTEPQPDSNESATD
jgi:hypothetical protein